MSLLEVDRVNSFYGDFQALYEVSLAVDVGETLAIIGANGAGKSTLLNVIAGLFPNRGGAIRFDGMADRSTADAPPCGAWDLARAGRPTSLPQPDGS